MASTRHTEASIDQADTTAGTRRAWTAFLVCTLFGAIQIVIPGATSLSTTLPPTFLVVAACWYAALKANPGERVPWALLTVGMGSNALADLIYEIIARGGDVPPASLADVFYLLTYPFLLIGMTQLVRQRATENVTEIVVDAAAAATLVGMIIWQVLVSAPGGLGDGTLIERIVLASYPVGDILLLSAVATVLFTRARRHVDMLAMLGFGFVTFTSDVLYAASSSVTTSQVVVVVSNFGYFVGYGLLAAAGLLQPVDSGVPRPNPRTSGMTMRLALLSVSLCSAPAFAFGALLLGYGIDLQALSAFAVAMCVIVTVRLVGLVRGLERGQRSLSAAKARMSYQAYHDHLTGLPNRPFLSEQIDAVLAEARRTGRPTCLLYVDLDDFKSINDRLGHAQGDMFLRAVADRLRGAIRREDFVARVGGDEFVVVCPDASPVEGHAVATKILTDVREPLGVADVVLHPGASIGLASSVDCVDPQDLIANADLALYAAKRSGVDIESYVVQMRAFAEERASIATMLRAAVDGDELELVYQPVIDLPTGRVASVEALLRWPRREDLAIPHVIAVAEQSALIHVIGRRIFERACRDIAAINDQRAPAARIGVAVNVSMRQLMDDDLAEIIQGALASSGLDPSLLHIELTETCLSEGADTTLRALRLIRESGVTVALDDFGTGYSSLGRLAHLPIDGIKIDRSFVTGLDTTAGRHLFAAIAELAEALGLQVIAEGIELPDQAVAVLHLGCRSAQGDLFAPPMPIDDLRIFLDARPVAEAHRTPVDPAAQNGSAQQRPI